MTDQPREVVRQSEFARRVGLTRGRISQLIAEGKLRRPALVGEKPFKVDVQLGLQQLSELDPARQLVRAAKTDLAGTPIEPIDIADPEYRAERTRQARLDADLKELRLRRERGQLLDADEVAEAMATCAGEIVRILEQLPSRAEDVAHAIEKGGAPALQKLLKEIGLEMREGMAEAMRGLTSETRPPSPH